MLSVGPGAIKLDDREAMLTVDEAGGFARLLVDVAKAETTLMVGVPTGVEF